MGCCQIPGESGRDLNVSKEALGIQVGLAGLIHDADQTRAIGLLVFDRSVDLSLLQRRRVSTV